MARYRCVGEGCGWQGLLPRRRHHRRRFRHVRRHQRAWVLPLALLALVTLAAAALLQQLMQQRDPPRVPLGESHYGVPLLAAHPLQVRFVQTLAALPEGSTEHGLTLREHCAWGKPGGNPYQGSVEQALQAAALPSEVVAAVAQQVREQRPVEALVIGNDGIRASRSGRVFDATRFAMTYGRTLCLNTRVNFAPGHTEPAALYEASGHDGRRYAVMVPEVCGNVSVIAQGRDARSTRLALGLTDGEPWTVMPAQLDWDPTAGGRDGTVRTVPEPGSLGLAGLGLLVLAWLRLSAGRPGRPAPAAPCAPGLPPSARGPGRRKRPAGCP